MTLIRFKSTQGIIPIPIIICLAIIALLSTAGLGALLGVLHSGTISRMSILIALFLVVVAVAPNLPGILKWVKRVRKELQSK